MPPTVKPNYYQGDFYAMRDYLCALTWLQDGNNLEMVWIHMKSILLEVTDKFIPKRFTVKRNTRCDQQNSHPRSESETPCIEST